MDRDCGVLTFTGLWGVSTGSDELFRINIALSLVKPTPLLLSARSELALNKTEYRELEKVDRFLVLRSRLPVTRGPERDAEVDVLQNALMAFQAIKPLAATGLIFQGSEYPRGKFRLETTIRRPPMEPGEWARMRTFDRELLVRVPVMIEAVSRIMRGRDIRKRNAMHLFQLALEHPHPLIACLLAVIGMDAILDSENREDFRNKLCACLGDSSQVFPDWNSPLFEAPQHQVSEIAVPLYMLRSKIAHGADLREAARDKKFPVDFLRETRYIPASGPVQYARMLYEASICLLTQVLQKTIDGRSVSGSTESS